MDKHVQRLLQDLARTCPASDLQQKDWEEMYEICLYAHLNAIVLTPRSLRVFLHEQGCSVQKAAFLSHQVEHLTRILSLYDERRAEQSARD